ncbi:MAG: ADP-ribosylglycohydrolase family protein, partial [Deltaproteobacteria bacterium]|nr:ADP-ribosylglycohydrolase family protein [Deltaproteobacteria bacterium]
VHWIYDTKLLESKYGRVESFRKPEPESYHPTKNIGEFTHYGDQSLVLLESLHHCGGRFDLLDFSARWRNLFLDYQGYMDGATKGTLANLAAQKSASEAGSSSSDLAGAARMAPLIYFARKDIESLIRDVRLQTQMTHTNRNTVDSAEFFARCALSALNGEKPAAAMRKIAGDHFAGTIIESWVDKGLQSIQEDSVQAILKIGQTCHTPHAFPGVVHLIAKYENNYREALIQNVMAGGDSAARGMMVGMILGASLGWSALPEDWLAALRKREQIVKLLDQDL